MRSNLPFIFHQSIINTAMHRPGHSPYPSPAPKHHQPNLHSHHPKDTFSLPPPTHTCRHVAASRHSTMTTSCLTTPFPPMPLRSHTPPPHPTPHPPHRVTARCPSLPAPTAPSALPRYPHTQLSSRSPTLLGFPSMWLTRTTRPSASVTSQLSPSASPSAPWPSCAATHARTARLTAAGASWCGQWPAGESSR